MSGPKIAIVFRDTHPETLTKLVEDLSEDCGTVGELEVQPTNDETRIIARFSKMTGDGALLSQYIDQWAMRQPQGSVQYVGLRWL